MSTVSKSEKKASRRDRKATAAAPNVLSMLQGRNAPPPVAVADDEPDSQEVMTLPTSVVKSVPAVEVDEFADAPKPTLEAAASLVSSGVDAAREATTSEEFLAATDTALEGLEAARSVMQDVVDFGARLEAHQAEVKELLSPPPGVFLHEWKATQAAADKLHREELQAGVPVQRPAVESVVVAEAAPPAFSGPAPEALAAPDMAPAAETAPMSVEARIAVEPPAADAEIPVKAAPSYGRTRRLAAWMGRMVKRVDWVAVAILVSIPLMLGAAFLFGAVAVTTTLVATLCVAAVVLLAVGRLQDHAGKGWQFKRVLFRVSLLVGVAALLFFASGQHWQMVVAGMVFYLFGDRLLRK